MRSRLPRAVVLALPILPFGRLASAQPSCTATTTHDATTIAASVSTGERFEHRFGGRFTLQLVPIPHGWRIEVHEDGREEDLARLTPPWHFVPNPRFIEGWHFRNASNTGPNRGSVNAPQEMREFVFSPEVGRTLEYGGSATPPGVVDEVARFGRGRLEIHDYVLTPPAEGERAAFREIGFETCLVWRSGG